jgi:hypothetical protein
LPETTDYTRRGLQGRTTAGARKHRAIRSLALDAVLRKQKVQRDEGINDHELISISYKDVCMNLEQEAYVRGISDAKVAEDF